MSPFHGKYFACKGTENFNSMHLSTGEISTVVNMPGKLTYQN